MTATTSEQRSSPMDENVEAVRRFYNRVINADSVDAVSQFISADFDEHIPHPMPGQPFSGPEAILWFVKTARAAMPDLTVTIDDVIAAGDKVVTRVTWRGTQTGQLMGADPTGKQLEFSGIDICRLKGGKIVEHWGQIDVLAAISQLGFMPV